MNQKLHRPLVNEVVTNLNVIFNQKKYADKVIEQSLRKNHTWGARDRAFIAENTYDIVRWIRLYQFCLTGHEDMRPLKQHQMFAILAIHFMIKGVDLPAWPEFDGINYHIVMQRRQQALDIPKINQSVPDWLDDMGTAELGENWQTEMTALNQKAPFVIRINTLKSTKRELVKNLADLKVETEEIEGYPDALLVLNKTNLFKTEIFKEGHFEVQDASSQKVAAFLDLNEPNMRVIDACAGAGGKSLHVAALMQNKGKLISMDVEQWKLDELRKRARRAGVSNVETRLIEANTVNELKDFADRLLIDAPCSGLGVLKRNPDAKWKLQADFIENIKKTQQEILDKYHIMVKKGGKMLYVTCSIMPSENQNQVATFLANNTHFTLEKEEIVLPSATGFDGFYMALMVKR
jgi:16S rRNA (cytosine967-C5)-methyltransferase